jgi:hypothetical protein
MTVNEIKTSKEDMMKIIMFYNTAFSEHWQWLKEKHPMVARECIENIRSEKA